MKPGWMALLVAFLWSGPALAERKLAEESGCVGCHGVEEKGLVGPSFKDIAERYAGQADVRERLIEAVTNGGKGNWSEVTAGAPMPPYSRTLTQEQIDALVDWVMSQ